MNLYMHIFICTCICIHVQAQITLNAARESEIEDEGRLHALQRRWRVTQEQLGALDSVRPH